MHGIVCETSNGLVLSGAHAELGTHVAIKVVAPTGEGSRRRSDAPGREARITASLSHPHIVRVLDHGPGPWGGHCTVLAWAPGDDLDVLLARGVALGAARSLHILRQLADALDHAHARGVVHGDVKPANVRVDLESGDFVTLLDFGIARDARDPRRGGRRFVDEGTMAYLAPECAAGDRAAGAAADRWSFAAVALEVVTGARPYPDAPPAHALEMRRRHPPLLPSDLGIEHPGLDALFAQALARRPEARPPSARAFVHALDTCILGTPRDTPRRHGTAGVFA